jgi:hypothetical protein
MSKKRKFKVNKRENLSDEEKIKRRAIIFGVLTIVLIIAIVVWGIPLFIRLVDYLGDLKSSSQPQTQEDTIPPPVPRFTYIPEATNSGQLEITGVTEPNSLVYLTLNGNRIETTVNEEGDFEIEKVDLKKGKNTLSASAEDEAGNESDTTEQLEIIYDTEEPELEVKKPEDGSVSDEQVVQIEGQTEPSARALVNDHVVIVDQQGKFTYRMTLQEGSNEIKVMAEDKAGNTTEKELTVTYLP